MQPPGILRWCVRVREVPWTPLLTPNSVTSCPPAGQGLVRLGYGLTGDRQAAEDLAQTALAGTYAAWPRVRRADDPDAYVRRILLNVNRSRFRARRVAEQLTADPPDLARQTRRARGMTVRP